MAYDTPGDITLRGTASQIAWASEIRLRVSAEFERFAKTILTGANRFRALDPAGIESLLALLEEHRAGTLVAEHAEYFIDNWQDPADRVQRTMNADLRWKSILEAKTVRPVRIVPLAPVRYLGFRDVSGTRVYTFGRLPSHDGAETWAVSMPVALFLKHKISFQDGPAMCSAILAANPEPCDHHVTDDDSLEFISKRPVKTERKPFSRKQSA